jgi:hypothetical protein
MSDIDTLPYTPTERFNNVNTLYGNHFRFFLVNWPDVEFNTQSVSIPAITSGSPNFATPFASLPQVGDHLHYGTFDLVFLLDRTFQTYFSLYYWMRGYGKPHSYEEAKAFQDAMKTRVATNRPQLRELEKTRAVLTILQPDTNAPIAEIQYEDVFPTALGELTFETTQSQPSLLTGRVTFATSDFHINLTS